MAMPLEKQMTFADSDSPPALVVELNGRTEDRNGFPYSIDSRCPWPKT
jgi:hypothetical protein